LSQKELFGEEIWSTIQTIVGAIDFTNGDDYSSSPAIYDETCDSIMSEVGRARITIKDKFKGS